jgi:protoporphyrinogen oxidase
MKICVIGGGLCGLVAARKLADSAEVDLLESNPYLGGCLASYDIDGYRIEQYYHHCFAGDGHLMALLSDLGIEDRLEWLAGTTGYYADGTIYSLTTPTDILKYPYLSLLDKARLAWLTLRSKRFDAASLDSVTARDFILDHLGEGVYASFFEPLLRSKFGEHRNEVSAAWLISRIAIRSNRGTGGERLGYLKGGFQLLIDRLEEEITRKGCSISTGAPARTIERQGSGWLVNGRPYDHVLSTIPPQETARLSGLAIKPIPYQGAACMTLALGRDVTKGIYWLNMKDSAPYGAVVAHANFAPPGWYNGDRIIYLASYFTGDLPQTFAKTMLTDFCRRFGVEERDVRWTRMAVDTFAGPIYTTGFAERLPEYEQHGLSIAGMFSPPNYPERSMEGSVIAAEEVVERIEKRYAHEHD